MQALKLDIDFEAELRALQAERSRNRSKGLHQSEIIHHIVSKLEPNRFGDDSPIDPILAQSGFLWEDVMSRVLTHQIAGTKGQLELENDGIFQTLDGFSAQRWRIIEAKATKMSARNPIRSRKFDHWHMQIMGYCKTMRTIEAELYPLFINGSYELAGGRFGKMIVTPYLMTYTQREIDDNWRLMLMTRDEILEAA